MLKDLSRKLSETMLWTKLSNKVSIIRLKKEKIKNPNYKLFIKNNLKDKDTNWLHIKE